jgi:CIC family chloride channel protein
MHPLGPATRSLFRDFGARIGAIIRSENTTLMVLAVLLGVLGGYCALGFRAAATGVLILAFGSRSSGLVARIAELDWWQILLPPVAIGLVVGFVNLRLLAGRRAQGVAHIIECSALNNAEMPLRSGLFSALASALSIGAGASVGREGAILNLTSTLSSWVGQHSGLAAHHRHTILGCGVAAALAASFNAPIAGVFFALEVVIGHYALSAFAPVVISSVIGTIITRIHFGDFPAYVLPHYEIVTYWEFPALLLLGLVAGLVAAVVMEVAFRVQDLFTALKAPDWLKPALGGLIVGLIALRFPQVLSVGYETTNLALQEQLDLKLLILLAVLKTAATSISIGSGFGGGIFSPSLFIGAMTGGAFGVIASSLFPSLGVHPGLYAVVGMAAASSAIIGAPISTILIVFELLGDFKVTISVMTGAAVSTLLVQQLVGESYYIRQLSRRGLVLSGGRALQILRSHTVAEAMTAPHQLIPATTKLKELKLLLHCLPDGAEAMVVGPHNRLVGTIGREDLRDVAFDPLVDDEALEAQHLTHLYFNVLPLNTSLEAALKIVEKSGEERLPVVKDMESLEVAGMVDHKTLLSAYNEALLQAEAETRGHGTSARPGRRAAVPLAK